MGRRGSMPDPAHMYIYDKFLFLFLFDKSSFHTYVGHVRQFKLPTPSEMNAVLLECINTALVDLVISPNKR